ncbi:peptidase M23-like protein [Tamilnaduibacter salinus]|uniref:Peptidase M23-like protein n=1 Tax=Tamilnaduibacter salinus TaxID=1484056 RepID=A0A2A2I374_9GAMM|nr:M23 family metallopeptidase [Tamilnaduibacter salinus]PAV26032.1 hypothetical protein CF392_07950 [Tamilnaduibacter salinus]PVY78834.1 peptidase M23-like protein [Tamilnaduibacter salinus]
MNLIVVTKKHGRSHSLNLNLWMLGGLVLAGMTLLLAVGYGGYRFAQSQAAEGVQGASPALVKQWHERLSEQKERLQSVQAQANRQIDALTLRLGEMQGRLLRLDALGQRLVESSGLANGEFNFDQAPAVGGPESPTLGPSLSPPGLSAMIDRLESQISSRESQLRLLNELLSRERLEDERFVAGRPITWGWLSSHYGYRTDPFSGKRAWHSGVDLAGKEGSDIIAVAAGVVTYADDRYGYGNLVEIDHGDGLVTRYAHCKSIEVSVGDVVEKGQVVALMGSTGRSTGPHVHFEVLRDGKTLDPEKYIRRASR